MSRKKRSIQHKKKSAASSSPSGKTVKPWEPVTDEKDPLYKKIFTWSSGALLLIMLVLSLGSGINGDDEYQVDYSEKLVNYYATMGADTSALYIDKGNMHLYGGFFDLTTGLVNKALGYEEIDQGYHNVRHLFNAIFGFLAMLFTALLIRQVAGWRAAILALFLMFLSPRFLGHSLMNPKDIPFAAGFAIALHYMVVFLRKMPKPDWRSALGLALGIALALATRAGGLLLIAYFFLFAAYDFLSKYGVKGITKETKAVVNYLGYGLGISLAGYFLAILTWPAALVDPFGHPFDALSEFSKLGVRIRLLFEGENVMSDDTVWYYPVLWMIKTIPLYVLIGFAGSLVVLPGLLKKYPKLPILLLYFATIFPICYIIYKDSLLHDGWRHLMFVYPSMLALTALFWVFLEDKFKENKNIRYAIWGILGLLVVESTLFIVRNPHYPYVYFNPIGGGISGAYGYYETDYWGVSVKQAIDWMDKQGILDENMQDTVIIGTTFYFNVSRQTAGKYNGKVITKYVRFNQRYREQWDYGIFPSRYIRGPHLRSGNWPNGKTIHTVEANGVPLLAIEKEEDLHAYQGETAVRTGNFQEAVSQFSQEIQQYPNNELAWLGMANSYLNLGNNQEAINAAQKAMEVAPDNVNAWYFKGLAQLRSGNVSEALQSMLQATEVNDDYYVAYYYLGVIYKERGNLAEALRNTLKALELSPRFKAGYELAASIYQQQGDQQNAARYMQAAQKL